MMVVVRGDGGVAWQGDNGVWCGRLVWRRGEVCLCADSDKKRADVHVRSSQVMARQNKASSHS